MGPYVADRIIKAMLRRNINLIEARILVLGLTFKENCPDTRNSKVIDVINALSEYSCEVDVYDPKIKQLQSSERLKCKILSEPKYDVYDAIVLAVAHDEFINQGVASLRRYGNENHILFDLKYAFSESQTDERL